MIHHILGTVIAIDNQVITVQPQASGIGLGIFVPHKEAYLIGKEVHLYTYVHWNQEQGPTLYGFTHESERKVFLLMISCSGIGPKIALATLETTTPQAFIQAVHEENIQLISSIPGIGKKKAEQIIVNLKHKIENVVIDIIDPESSASIKDWHQVSEVLTSLNYSRQEIQQAMQYLKQQGGSPEISFDTLLRKALSFLSKLR